MRPSTLPQRPALQEGWVLANHILVSFHVAFISSVLALPLASASRGDVLEFIFFSPETLVSALFTYLTFHTGIALHEMGHFLTAARLNALNEGILEEVQGKLRRPLGGRLLYLARTFVLAPYGAARGIKREGLNYYPDAPYNLAVAAAGPRASMMLAWAALPPAALLLTVGLLGELPLALYAGRLCLGLGLVGLLDFLIADPGKYRAFRERERKAREAAQSVTEVSRWEQTAASLKEKMKSARMQEAVHPQLGPVAAPWQYRNCGMGGRHTEKEYPESNISMQEAMFLILGARDVQEGQEMTVQLQNRLKEIIEKSEGCRVMGIGLEGGLAPYIDRGDYPLPELRLWAMMKQTIEECGYRPGHDVAIALDPAMNELEFAYREEFNVPDAVGMYLFWRDKSKVVLDRDEVLDIYRKAIQQYDIPILSIEDGFSEDDFEGWRQLLQSLGDRLFIIGDDLVTTNDKTIEFAASQGLINTVLVKANQIGTLSETLLAVLVGLGKGLDLVVSHRSKSPNDDMEAHIALAANAMGLKAGGGANTERLVKYQAVNHLMGKVPFAETRDSLPADQKAVVRNITASEEPTNAGIPTVGVDVEVSLPGAGVHLDFRGSTPLGTSAGTGEAVHLVDAFVECAEHREVMDRHPDFFREAEPGVSQFKKGVTRAEVEDARDDRLTHLFVRAQRYNGKGCLNAVDNVRQVIASAFTERNLAAQTLASIDRDLLRLEVRTARRRDKLAADASLEDVEAVAQRKQNLGMNAVLSVSLALARGVAHVHGMNLYELLREEMLSIIERLAAAHGVAIDGSRLPDYVRALREVNDLLEERGTPLYQELRRISRIYHVEEAASFPEAPTPPAELDTEAAAVVAEATPAPAAPVPEREESVASAQLLEDESKELAELDRALHQTFASESEVDPRPALQSYLAVRSRIEERCRRFEIVNYRILRSGDQLYIPYQVGTVLEVHRVDPDSSEVLATPQPPAGTLCTDDWLAAVAGTSGEVIDLDPELLDFDVSKVPEVRIERVRDMAALLETVNACASRVQVMYYLRFVVARLCSRSWRGFLGAKNLQPEVNHLRTQLVELLNGPFAGRLRLPIRVLVRNISGLISRPSIIDQLWQDTIDLAEIHVQGSSITNELRRSCHHSLGKRTHELARAYFDYLTKGETTALVEAGFEGPSTADEEARLREVPVALVEKICTNLEKLLGTSQIVERIRSWQDSYAESLMRCDFGNDLDSEREKLITRGIRARNRWSYNHHLRIVCQKAEESGLDPADRLATRLSRHMNQDPESEDFDVETTVRDVNACIDALTTHIRETFQKETFAVLDEVTAAFERGEFAATFSRIHALRDELRHRIRRGGFRDSRFLLYQLDCLLEEMGYLALRHVATEYEEHGLDLRGCLGIIQKCVDNLRHDGLLSRDLPDHAAMLNAPGRTHGELLNVLDAIQVLYHKLFHRMSIAYQTMGERLGLGAEELRAVLANLQRYLHDFNSVAHFVDLARSHIQRADLDRSRPVVEGAPPEPRPAGLDVVRLSHLDEVDAKVRSTGRTLSLQELYGGKGSGLLYIRHLRLPTPGGFILPTTLGRSDLHRTDWPRVEEELRGQVSSLEQELSLRFGQTEQPLLLAVRGGSVFSMPGMLATILFVGMNDEIAESLARTDPWLAYDSYRRFLGSYADAVWGVDLEEFRLVEDAKRRCNVTTKSELPWQAMRDIVGQSKALLRQKGLGVELAEVLADPWRQLAGAVRAVLESWNSERARRYREIKGLSDSWHTAVIVQRMVFGNYRNEAIQEGMDETHASLTGVIPQTWMTDRGVRALAGDIKFSAVGDDLVAGLVGPDSFEPVDRLASLMPVLHRSLLLMNARLRRFRGTDPEIEFTVERGVLNLLQARPAEFESDGDLATFDEPGPEVAHGIGVRGGAFRGLAAFDEDDLVELQLVGQTRRDDVDGVLLILENPAPDQIPVALSADGLLTARGGSTSHAAVAAHAITDRPFCTVLGVSTLRVNARRHEATVVNAEGRVVHHIRKGDVVSIHGQTGAVYAGSRPLFRVPDTEAPARESVTS